MDPNWSADSFHEFRKFGPNGDITALSVGAPGKWARCDATKIIRDAMAKRLTEEVEAESSLMQYGNTRGDPKYRTELAKFLTKQYGAPVDRDDLICTAGATHGLYTLGSLLFQAGDVVFVEDPTFFVALNVFRKDFQLQLVPVPTDAKGMDVDSLDRLMTEYKDKGKTQVTEKKPFRSMIYLIPCFHNPTSRCMAPERCQRVVELARKHDSLVVCDDVYNTLSWIHRSNGSFGDPPQRVFAYDKKTDPDYEGHVVSNGSFSKIMGPGLRLGWWEAPARLHTILRDSGYIDSGGGFNQFTGGIIGTALEMGLVEKHINDIRKTYQGGYFIWIEFPDDFHTAKLRQTCLDSHKVSFLLGSSCSPEGNYRNCIRLAFSYYPKEELVKAVTKIAEATTRMIQQ